MDLLTLLDTINQYSSLILIIFAAVGGWFAYKNICVLREQHRRKLFLNLMNELADNRSRENRAIIHDLMNRIEQFNYDYEHIKRLIEDARKENTSKRLRRIKEAIEETISCFDRLGYFLLKGDKLLINDAPLWIWTMTSGMWEKLGSYVAERQHKGEPYWGMYFAQLAEEAKKHL